MAANITVQQAREARNFHRPFLFDKDIRDDLDARFEKKFEQGFMTPMMLTTNRSLVHHIALDFDLPVSICGMKGEKTSSRMGGALVNTVCPVCTTRWVKMLKTFLRDRLAAGKHQPTPAMVEALRQRNPYKFLRHFINDPL